MLMVPPDNAITKSILTKYDGSSSNRSHPADIKLSRDIYFKHLKTRLASWRMKRSLFPPRSAAAHWVERTPRRSPSQRLADNSGARRTLSQSVREWRHQRLSCLRTIASLLSLSSCCLGSSLDVVGVPASQVAVPPFRPDSPLEPSAFKCPEESTNCTDHGPVKSAFCPSARLFSS